MYMACAVHMNNATSATCSWNTVRNMNYMQMNFLGERSIAFLHFLIG